jgi:16S rRNA processing protein RimM
LNKNKDSLKSLIYVGEIIKPHGIKGYLKFFLYNEESEVLFDNKIVYLENEEKSLKLEIENINSVSSVPLIKFFDVNSREEASKYRKLRIGLSIDSFKKNDDDLYLFNFINCNLYFDEDYVGLIKNVVTFSGNDLLLVESGDCKKHYVPINKKLIKFFDIEDRKLVMNKIDGLLDIC